MQTLLVLLLFYGLGNCVDENNSTEKNIIPIINELTDKKWDTLFRIIIALILLMFLIAIVCLIFILLLCWKRRRQQQQKKPKDIEQSSTVITQTPQHLIIPPSQNNNVLLKSNDPTPLLHRQQDIPHSPITSDPEVVGFRPIQSPEFKKNAKIQNPEMPKPKRSASENPKLKKTVDAQKRTDTSSNVSSSSAISSPRSKKAKTPRQAKNGAILNIAIQTDLDTSDE
uniref:Uncharacterized protein n=1 Tax=Panagrolaimus sp. PS1159 TaxID=55785 RepID=A0AC35GIT3_9BILA